MAVDIIKVIIGVALVLKGADWLTNGAVVLARNMYVPEMVIGMTIVAMGTSMPEFFVSFTSAVQHTADLAVGNIVGSNIINSLLIVGAAAITTPMIISRETVRKDMPFAVGASALFILFCLDRTISRLEAAIIFIAFIGFMVCTFYKARKGKKETDCSTDGNTTCQARSSSRKGSSIKALVLIIIGLTGLILGSDVFVDAARSIARASGVSEAVIGLTIVAGGTSLPELATSIVATRKGQSAIAIGNVIGSNIFNILMILGFTGLICPLTIVGVTAIDLTVLLVSVLIVWLCAYTKFTISRWEGFVLTALYLCYLSYLIINI